ncbi:enhancer of split malpha protein-like [Diprion similis]|uniref:enhancer of split malpha protein-like n=1 Tax=Diprion similis TaxID=362088 RepID=UPI001EF99D5B|nr:enhancer of split malpha protein-like [Diprion similis]
MAATTITNHVFECENELNDNLYNIKLSSSKKQTSSVRRVKKILKPLLRLLKKSGGSKKNAKSLKGQQRAQPQVEVFTEEVDNQNNANEALEQRLLADLEEAEEGAAITVCLDGQMTVVPVVPGQCYVPVHFAHTHAGDFYWTTVSLADSDLCYKERAFSQNQQPEMQVA